MPAAAGVRPWIIASVVIVAALAVGILGASLRRRHASLWTITCGLGLAAVALVSTSAWASGSVVVAGEGPFDTPYQSPAITYLSQVVPAHNRANEWPLLVRFADASLPSVAADVFESSYFASEDIFATGHEFLRRGLHRPGPRTVRATVHPLRRHGTGRRRHRCGGATFPTIRSSSG